jgi:hypothetical protein
MLFFQAKIYGADFCIMLLDFAPYCSLIIEIIKQKNYKKKSNFIKISTIKAYILQWIVLCLHQCLVCLK